MSIRRLVYPSEEVEFYENMCVMIEFETDLNNKLKEKLMDTIRLLKLEHPYLRMKIIKNEEDKMEFVEQSEQEQQEIYLECFDLDTEEKLRDEWQARFIKFGSKRRPLDKSVYFFELYSYQNTKHQIYLSMNHAGNDGIGLFYLMKQLFSYLDKMLEPNSNFKLEKIESRKFLDLYENLKHEFDIEQLKKEPLSQDIYHSHLDSYDFSEEIIDNKNEEISRNYVSFELSESLTKSLIENCRLNKATMQGVVSLATMIALINEKDDFNEIINKNLSVLNATAINMRYACENVSNEDLVFATGFLFWFHDFKLSDKIWTIASNVTAQVHKLRENKEGLKHWIKCNNGIIEYARMYQSSIGVVSLGESNLKNIKLIGSKVYNSTYDNNFPENYGIVFAHTFLNKLNIGLTNSYPRLSKAWSENFLNNIQTILVKLASKDTQNLTALEIGSLLEKFQKK